MSRDGRPDGSFTKHVEFPPEELLIDFGNDAPKTTDAVPASDGAFSEEDEGEEDAANQSASGRTRAATTGDAERTTLLCGYMNKQSTGFVKNFRKRWFVYSEDTCKLLYFRSPNDIINLGSIDISKASFHFDQVQERDDFPGLFEIRSGGKTFILQAADRQAMLYWLQELQTRRRNYSHKRTALSQQINHTPTGVSLKLPQAGLLSSQQDAAHRNEWEEFLPSSPEFLAPVAIPCAVGQNNAISTNHKFSLKNLKAELRSTLRRPRQSSEDNCLREDEYVIDFPHEIPVELNSGNSRVTLSNNRHSGVFTSLKRKLSKSKEDIHDISLPLSGANGDACTTCSQLQQYILTLKDDLQVMEGELLAHQQMVNIMQRQIDAMQTEKQTREEVSHCSDEASQMALILSKAKMVSDLEQLLNVTQQEKEMITQKQRQLEAELTAANEDIQMYQDTLQLKDEMVMSLTNQVFQLESPGIMNSPQNSAVTMAPGYSPFDVEKWKLKVQGYEVQNKFLNKEIFELSELRKEDEKREKMLIMRNAELEAKFYQIQSKYLLCLEQLRQPQIGGENTPSQEMVNQLLQEAIDMDMDATASESLTSNSSPNRDSSYDQFGFSMTTTDNEEDLIAKATTLQRKSEEITNKLKDVNLEASIGIQWENYLLSVGLREIQRSPELKSLIRSGIPHQHKERVWNVCVNFRVGRLREQLGLKYYQNLNSSKRRSGKHNPAAKQIELDLLRTLPSNKHYTTLHSDGINKLRRVLLAYSWHNPVIGYCQGLNRLVAIALLFLTEEDAFWLLVGVIEYIMPKDYFSTTLMAAQTDQRVLKDIVSEKLPRLHAHLERHEVDMSLFTFNWFLTIFVDNIPVETYLRIWDAFLYEGNKVLFRFAVAFFKHREEEILQLNDTIAINNYLRVIGEKMVDIKRITQIAFHELNPFPIRTINSKRSQYLLQVKGELAELDALREDCRAHQDPRDRSDFVSDDDL